ncbi:MAG TPA: DUF4157 domain-containing protein [Longimicrobiales bacterium]
MSEGGRAASPWAPSAGRADGAAAGAARTGAAGPVEAPPIVHAVLAAPGRPLDPGTRDAMERRFGHVRVHTDGRAAESARAVDAVAYTVGRDVVFGAGRYAPDTARGRRLLAHELAHVVQQQQGSAAGGRGALLQRQTPEEIAAEVGPVSGVGGLVHDTSRTRMSIIVGANDTLRTIARRLLPIWNNAAPFTPPGSATPNPVTQLTEEQLARGLLVYNRYYLPVPHMTEWKVGLRFPLPIDVNRVTGERSLHPDIILSLAGTFQPEWESLLDLPPAAVTTPAAADLEASARTFLRDVPDANTRGINLSTRALRNAREAEPFIREVFRQASGDAFELALAFMDQIVIHQFDLLASQAAGQEIIAIIRDALARAPATPSPSQQQSLARANRLLNRLGVFSAATAERVRNIYVTDVPGSHCMQAVYHGFEGIFSEGVSESIQEQVSRESREVMRRTRRDTNHMDRIMEAVRARGLAGREVRLVYQRASDTWLPDPETTVLGMTHPDVAGWYFFGFSIHGAYHSVILAVDKTDPDNPRIYWMDQHSRGFTNDVTGRLMDEMRSFEPPYGFPPTRLWQLIPAADTLIVLD